MNYQAGTILDFSEQLSRNLFSYRYQVFIKTLGWELPVEPNNERDKFDIESTHYVIAQDQESIVGCARLLPCEGPYLLEEVFPELLGDVPAPKSSDVWELSRFSTMDVRPNTKSELSQQFSRQFTPEMIEQVMKQARELGAKRLIGVCPVGVERTYRRMGYKTYRAAPPKVIDGYPLIACWVELY